MLNLLKYFMMVLFFITQIPIIASGQEIKAPKKQIIAGIRMGSERSEIQKTLAEKGIMPQQRTSTMDTFPRLPGEITYIKKAYLFYTKDKLSKISILFNVPVDSKDSSGDLLFNFYGEVRKTMIQTYGQPTNTTSYVHPNFPYKLVALETGNAYYFDYWENVDDLKILLSLKGEKEEINFSLTYQYIPIFKEK